MLSLAEWAWEVMPELTGNVKSESFARPWCKKKKNVVYSEHLVARCLESEYVCAHVCVTDTE